MKSAKSKDKHLQTMIGQCNQKADVMHLELPHPSIIMYLHAKQKKVFTNYPHYDPNH